MGFVQLPIDKKSVTFRDNNIQAESLGDFSENLGKKGLNVSKELAKNVLKNPGRMLGIGANVGSAFASRSPKSALSSLPEENNFYHTGTGLYLPKFLSFLLYKWKREVIYFILVHD